MENNFTYIHERSLAREAKLNQFREDLEKGRAPLTGGEWKTINGAKVYLKGGKVAAGAEGKLSDEGGSKSGSSKSSEGTPTMETFKKIARESKNVDDFMSKVRKVKNVPSSVAQEFQSKYGGGSISIEGASRKFMEAHGGSKSSTKTKESKSSEGSDSKATSKEIKEYLKYNPSKTKEQAEKYLNSMKAMSKFKTGTPVTFKDKMGRKVSGEIVNKNGKKQVSLYRDDNYSGSSERLVSPDWSKVESFNESNTKKSKSIEEDMDLMKSIEMQEAMNILEKGAMTAGNIYAKNPKDEVKKKIDKMFNPDEDEAPEPELKKKKMKLKKSVDLLKEYVESQSEISKAIEQDEAMHVLEKGKAMPVGTVSNGRKKTADGKWVPVKDEKKKVETKKEGGKTVRDTDKSPFTKEDLDTLNRLRSKTKDPKSIKLIDSKISKVKGALSNKKESPKKEGGKKEGSGGKSKAASKVLQLMDNDEDANYSTALNKVLKENPSLNKKELEKELDKYI